MSFNIRNLGIFRPSTSYQEGVLCFLWLNRAGIVLVMEYRYYSLPKKSR